MTEFSESIAHSCVMSKSEIDFGTQRENLFTSCKMAGGQTNNVMFHIPITSTLGLHEVDAPSAEFSREILNTLKFHATAGQMLESVLTQIATLNQTIVVLDGFNQQIKFATVISEEVTKALESAIGFTHQVVVSGRSGISESDGLIIGQSVSVLYLPCSICHQPVETYRGYITLQYPFDAPTHTVDLRNPIFGDTHTLTLNSLSRELITGRSDLFRPSDRPIFEKLIYRFDTMTNKGDFETFIRASIGEEIKLIDMQNNTWRGAITNGPIEIENYDNMNDAWGFEFEGDIV